MRDELERTIDERNLGIAISAINGSSANGEASPDAIDVFVDWHSEKGDPRNEGVEFSCVPAEARFPD